MENQYILLPYFLDEPLTQLETLAEPGWQIVKSVLPTGGKQDRMLSLYKPLADKVAENLSAGNRPVIISGDCCSAIGVTAGIQRVNLDPILIWFDAHGDFNTWETSPSGFLGGMPLAMLVGRGEQTMLKAINMKPLLEDHIILSDGRDLDPLEHAAIIESNVIHFDNVMHLLDYSLPEAPIHVHFDTDVIDPSEAPAMNYPAPRGPSAETLNRVFRRLAGTGRIKVVSLSSWNPALDSDLHTQRLSMRLLRTLVND